MSPREPIAAPALEWWKTAVLYHVYPLSFMDADGDGRGDLAGVLSRLDHIRSLGADGFWLSPVYPSPMSDYGYDVSDYRAINPMFGTMADFDRLLAAAHERGLRVIMDLVFNHTSEKHPWFVASRSSRTNPRRDWYFWRDPAPGGGAPNNWLGSLGGSAWAFDEATRQFYYHAFFPSQPDLDWRNPAVRDSMLGVMRFWLDKTVDGFRLDAMWHLVKDALFRDNPPNPDFRPGADRSYDRLLPVYSTNQPEVHEVIAAMRRVTDEYEGKVLIGEVYLPVNEVVDYYGSIRRGVHLPANFQLIELPWRADRIYAGLNQYEGSLPEDGWPFWVLSNHDKPRVASRIGRAQARVAALMVLTLRGTVMIYYGDEIGMQDISLGNREMKDKAEQRRDPQRSPMQWTGGPNAGFTTGTPWLPVGHDYRTVNVEAEAADPGSLLNFHKRLIALRRREPALSVGPFLPVGVERDILAYIRRGPDAGGRSFLVAANLSPRPGAMAIAAKHAGKGTVVLGTHPDAEGTSVGAEIRLRGDEAIVVELS